MAHCTLDAVRGEDTKYVQFAADGGLLPPILFDLTRDPDQLHDLVRQGEAGDLGWRSATTAPPMADAHRRPDAGRQHAHARPRSRRRPRRVVVSGKALAAVVPTGLD